MPLDYRVRAVVNDYLFKHIVPKDVHPRPKTAMEWFDERCDFIVDDTVRKHLAEALYQARYLGRIHEALKLPGAFNHGFIKAQVTLYASVFEAVIDYALEKSKDHPVVLTLLTLDEYVPLDALAGDVSLTQKHGSENVPLTVCRMKSKKRPLQLIRFDERVDAAHAIGVVPATMVEFIKTLYQSRNGIHVLNAARNDLKPDANESSEAFRQVMAFLRHASSWKPKTS